MQTKIISQKKLQKIFLYAAVSIGFLGATEVRGVTFEKRYNVVRVESVKKPVEHSITLGNARTGRLRTQSLNGPTQLGLSVTSDNCLVGYALGSPDETSSQYHVKVWLTKESSPVELTVGPVRSTFLPGKLLRDGPPEGDDIMVVYEVRDVFEESSKSNLRIKKICLPVEYRHHFERSVPPLDANSYAVSRKERDLIRESRIEVLLMILACTLFRARHLQRSCNVFQNMNFMIENQKKVANFRWQPFQRCKQSSRIS